MPLPYSHTYEPSYSGAESLVWQDILTYQQSHAPPSHPIFEQWHLGCVPIHSGATVPDFHRISLSSGQCIPSPYGINLVSCRIIHVDDCAITTRKPVLCGPAARLFARHRGHFGQCLRHGIDGIGSRQRQCHFAGSVLGFGNRFHQFGTK